MNVIDVGRDDTAAQIAEKIAALEPGPVALRVAAKRGATKWVTKIFSGDEKISRAARGSALVACGYGQITGEIDGNGDDVVKGIL